MGVRIASINNKLSASAQPTPDPLQNETFESQELFRRAEACIVRGRFDKAEEFLAEAIRISSENPLYLSYYGLCVGMRGDLLEAQKLCCKAVKLAPRSPIILVNCGRIWLAQGCRKEARDHFTRAYSIDNTNSAAALELSGMGVRRPPVFGALGRNHPLNCFLGRLRHRLLGYRKPGLKKR